MTIYDPDDPILIKAARDSGLADEFANDPVLLRFYMKKLMIRGWAGDRSDTEKRYTALVRKAFGTGITDENKAKMAKGRAAVQARGSQI